MNQCIVSSHLNMYKAGRMRKTHFHSLSIWNIPMRMYSMAYPCRRILDRNSGFNLLGDSVCLMLDLGRDAILSC